MNRGIFPGEMTAIVLSSPRTRRRLMWAGVAAAIVAVVAAASVLMPSRSTVAEPAATPTTAAVEKAPAPTVGEPRTVPVPRAEIDALLAKFIPAVIARKDLAAGWNLVTPDARGTRAEWERGTTPFQTFPAAGKKFTGWQVNYSYPGDVGFDIFVSPTDPENHVSMAFRGEAKKVGGAWRIAVFYPQATFQPVGKKAFVWADTDLAPKSLPPAATTGRLGAVWLLVPIGIFAFALVGALAFATARGLRRRARVRELARDLAATRTDAVRTAR